MNTESIIIDAIACSPRRVKENVWLDIHTRQDWTGYCKLPRVQFLYLHSPGPGGGWSFLGFGMIKSDYSVVLELKTVREAIYAKSDKETVTFESCVPGFPDNVVEFLERAAVNAQRASNISHKRAWKHHNRRFRSYCRSIK